MNNKERYRLYCNESSHLIPVYSKDWWLDAVCGVDKWDVGIIEKNKEIVASWPYYLRKKCGFSILTMPLLTQQLGILINFPKGQKYETRNSFEKKTILSLIDSLPRKDWYKFGLNLDNQNWLPFYWNGFKQTTFYTYILNGIRDIESTYRNLRSSVKTDLRKAEKMLEVEESDDIDLFYRINELTFKRQNLELPYSQAFVRGVDAACAKHQSRKIYFARDSQGRLHAGIFVVCDSNKAYYLMGGADPELRGSAGSTLLMWHAIKEASKKVNAFDFEGSMMPAVEKFVSGFGGKPEPYFFVEKVNSKMLKILLTLSDLK